MLFDYAVAVSVDVSQLMCKFPSSSYNNVRKGEREREKKKKRRKNNSNSGYTNLHRNTVVPLYVTLVVNEVHVFFLTEIVGFSIVCSLRTHIPTRLLDDR
jgi:cytoskeletal protein RodZ